MAGRPEKYTISYFPHYTNDSRSLYIIESKYGIEGYGFWFKILELLCNSKGLFYSCNDEGNMDYLLAKTKSTREKALEILNSLSNIKCIDKELWQQNKIIWCQNLVDNVADVFKRRISEIPQKPIYVNKNITKVNNNSINDNGKPINVLTSGISAPQRKLNEIKLNNTSARSSKELQAQDKINFNFETKEWENITKEDKAIWNEAYPACNIDLGLKQMKAWLVANPKKKKTNYKRFITNWFGKWQDKGGSIKSGKIERGYRA